MAEQISAGSLTNEVDAVGFSADGDRVAAGSTESGTVFVWDIQSGRRIDDLEGLPGRVISVAISPDGGRLAASSTDAPLLVWDLTSGDLRHQTREIERQLHHLSFSPDGSEIWATNDEDEARVWDGETGVAITPDSVLDLPLQAFVFSPVGTAIAGANRQDVWIGDLAGGMEQILLDGPQDVLAMAYSQGGDQLIAVGRRGSTAIWDVIPACID